MRAHASHKIPSPHTQTHTQIYRFFPFFYPSIGTKIDVSSIKSASRPNRTHCHRRIKWVEKKMASIKRFCFVSFCCFGGFSFLFRSFNTNASTASLNACVVDSKSDCNAKCYFFSSNISSCHRMAMQGQANRVDHQ